MAKLIRGILGPISGKLGPVVGGTWKGIAYLRELQEISTKPRTGPQVASQNRLAYVNKMLVPFHPYITVGFANLAKHRTEISAAFSANYHQAVTSEGPELATDYSKLMLSMGNLPMLDEVAIELIAPDTLRLRWENAGKRHAAYSDQLMLAVYSPELDLSDGFIGGTSRKARECTFKFNPKLAGRVLEAYVSVTSLDRKKTADSKYLGKI